MRLTRTKNSEGPLPVVAKRRPPPPDACSPEGSARVEEDKQLQTRPEDPGRHGRESMRTSRSELFDPWCKEPLLAAVSPIRPSLLSLRLPSPPLPALLAANVVHRVRGQHRVDHGCGFGLHAGVGPGKPLGRPTDSKLAHPSAASLRWAGTRDPLLRPRLPLDPRLGGLSHSGRVAHCSRCAELLASGDPHRPDGRVTAASRSSPHARLEQRRPGHRLPLFRQHPRECSGMLSGGALHIGTLWTPRHSAHRGRHERRRRPRSSASTLRG